MEFLLEDVAVALLVAVCAVFSAWRLLSPRLRLRVLDLASAVVGKAGNPWIPGLRARTLAKLGAGCGSCAHNSAAPAVHRRRMPG